MRRHLVRLGIPTGLAQIAYAAMFAIDVGYLTQLGTEAVAGVVLAAPMLTAVFAVQAGLAGGASIFVARALGADDGGYSARTASANAFALGALIGLGLSALTYTTQGAGATLLGAEGPTRVFYLQFMGVFALGVPVYTLFLVQNRLLVARGDARTPLTANLVAVAINLVLDPLLIFGPGPFPEWGVAGASLATVVSWAAGGVVTSMRLSGEGLWTFDFSRAAAPARSARGILSLTLPLSVATAGQAIAAGLLLRLVGLNGASAVAAFGMGLRIHALCSVPMRALGRALSPIVAQNHAAGRLERAWESVREVLRFDFLWGALTALALLLSSSSLGALFGDSAESRRLLIAYLLIVPISYGATSVLEALATAVASTGRGTRQTVMVFLEIAVTGALAVVGHLLAGAVGIYVGMSAASFLLLPLFVVMARRATRVVPPP